MRVTRNPSVVAALASGATFPIGVNTVTVTATDAYSGNTSTKTFTVTVGVPSLTISPETLDDAPGAQPYTATFVAADAIGDYTYALQSGALPAGLALAEDGSLTGTPTQYGTFEFTVIATDEEGFTGTRAYTLTVVSPELATSAKFLNGTSGTDYPSTTVCPPAVDRGPLTALQAETADEAGASNGGVISGRPTGSGRSSFSVTSVDAGGATVTAEYSITIRSAAPAPAPTIPLAPGPFCPMAIRVSRIARSSRQLVERRRTPSHSVVGCCLRV